MNLRRAYQVARPLPGAVMLLSILVAAACGRAREPSVTGLEATIPADTAGAVRRTVASRGRKSNAALPRLYARPAWGDLLARHATGQLQQFPRYALAW